MIRTTPNANGTCLEVLAKPLQSNTRPRDVDLSDGRFVACKASSFLDPEIFARGREVTLTGKVVAHVERRIGDAELRLPQVEVDQLLLWPEREPPPVVHRGPFFGWPFCGPFGCW